MILVVGATGFLGSEICRRLRANGETVRAFVRPGAKRERELRDLGIEIVHGDLKDSASVAAACRGVQSIICTATCIVSKKPGDTLKKVDHDGLLSLVETARVAGVEYFQFTSGSPSLFTNHPFANYKRVVEQAVRGSGMTWSVLQPSVFMETYFTDLAGWDLENRKVRVVGAGTNRISFISLYDVAGFSVEAACNPSLHDRDLLLGGPEALSHLDAVHEFERALGAPLKISHMPFPLLNLMKFMVRPFNPRLASILGLVTGGARVDDVIDMTETAKLIPNELTSVKEHAKKTVAMLKA